jgi:2,4-dienoyl-CoA reductase-like NADH-dependent reductase (Old Yellow Enzyme family)/thioredoxin reductase
MAYEKLLSPGKIGTLTLKNRSVFPPMGTHYCVDSFVTDATIAYYARRAQGGCAMVTVEVSSVHRTSREPLNVGLHDDKFLPGLTKLASAIKAGGAAAAIQLWHAGRQHGTAEAMQRELGVYHFEEEIEKPWAPSAIPCPLHKVMPHAMSLDEIHELIGAYGDAAVRAKKAGFDCVILHAAHGYLVDCFLNPYSNDRTDEYGGSLENRARFGQDIVRDIRKKLGRDFPVAVRISAEEKYPGGVTLEDTIKVAQMYEKSGADAIDISQGCFGTIYVTVPPYYMPEKPNEYNASQIKKNVGIPVICPGKLFTPGIAEEVLQAGSADFVGLGRIQIADPDFMKKTIEDRVDEIVHCIGCNSGCVNHIFVGKPVSCIFNPVAGHETTIAIKPAEKKKKVLVIGGGPGGLEAARVAKERGHDVVLFEKSPELGGQFLIAGQPPHKKRFADAAKHMGYRALKAGVDVRLYTTATPDRIAAVKPDVIIVATGSEPVMPKIPGIDGVNVFEARRVISGTDRVRAQTVAVIGGGQVGLEAAELLTEEGKKVIVIEMLDEVGKDVEMFIKPYTLGYLKDNNIEVHVNAKCVAIGADSVTVEKDGKAEEIKKVGAVVVAVGAKSDPAKVAEIASAYGECHVVGDAERPGKVIDAIWKANEVARAI